MKDFTHLSIANQPADIYTKVTVLVRATSQFGDQVCNSTRINGILQRTHKRKRAVGFIHVGGAIFNKHNLLYSSISRKSSGLTVLCNQHSSHCTIIHVGTTANSLYPTPKLLTVGVVTLQGWHDDSFTSSLLNIKPGQQHYGFSTFGKCSCISAFIHCNLQPDLS